MNHASRRFRDVDAVSEGVKSQAPVEALLLDRAELVKLLKRSLFELHGQRFQNAGTAAEADRARRIRYWEEVLGWVKSTQGQDVILTMQPRRA